MEKVNVDLIKEYHKENKNACVQRVKIACILGITLVPLFGLLDISVIPSMFLFFMKMRLVVSFLIAIILGSTFTKFGKRHPDVLGSIFFCIVGIMIAHMTRYLGGYKSTYYAGLNLLFLAMGVLMPWRLRNSIITSLVIYSFYIIPIWIFDKIDDIPILLNNNFFLLSTLIIAFTSNYFGYRLRFQEFQGRYNLAKAYDRLKDLDTLKTQFFSSVSHEFRTPLTLILAPIESILKGTAGDITAQCRNLVETVHNNTLRLLKLINNLLDLSKIDADKMLVNYEKLNLNEFIKGIVAEISYIAEKKNLSLEFIKGDDIPPFYFDPDKMEKIMINIIYNSVKFTDNGGRITISSNRENNNAIIKVTDTGIGIEKKDLEKIFDRFVQVDGSQKRSYEGTGIGLFLAKELIELHKGKIKAESKVGKGTTMTFTIPLIPEYKEITEKQSGLKEDDWTRVKYKEAEYSATDIIKPIIKETAPIKSAENGEKILIVEDNTDMLNFIAFQLEQKYRVLKATNGEEGLGIALRESPGLIITDIMMPVMDGYELCQKIKENKKTKHIPVIFLTAKAGLDMKIEGLEKGADEYLVKPFNAEELRARVNSLLNLKKLQREIQERNEELEDTLKKLKDTQGQLVHSEKMASLGQLVAGIAHEINNPIYSALMSAGAVDEFIDEKKEDIGNESIGLKLKDLNLSIKNGLKQASKIISELRDFSKKDTAGIKQEDIHKGLEFAMHLIHHRLDGKIAIHKNFSPEIGKIECSIGQLNQVFLNILQNSVDAIKDKGDIWISTNKVGDRVKISIKDNGIGIKEDNLQHIFEPFFTTKDVGEGVGLGMSISYQIVQNHNGAIDVKSKYGEGTEVIITIPIKHEGGNL